MIEWLAVLAMIIAFCFYVWAEYGPIEQVHQQRIYDPRYNAKSIRRMGEEHAASIWGTAI
jgi:hypothetical protein